MDLCKSVFRNCVYFQLPVIVVRCAPGLKANYPDDGSGTLDVVLARPPLFFRETNPQPRKHTLWQATSDFIDGQPTLNRRLFLQCPQGLIFGKKFEKFIQCDPRLSFLSQQP